MQEVQNTTDAADFKCTVLIKKRKGYSYVKSSKGKDSPLIPVFAMNKSRPSVIVVWAENVVIPGPEEPFSGDLEIVAKAIKNRIPLAFKTVKTLDSVLAAIGLNGYYRTILEKLDGIGSFAQIEGLGMMYMVPIFMSGRSTKGKGVAPIEKVKRVFEERNAALRQEIIDLKGD